MSRTSLIALLNVGSRDVPRRVPAPPAIQPKAPAAVLRFALPRPSPATVLVRSVEGRVVRTLLHGELAAGEHDCRWDGRDDVGAAVPAGQYVLVLEADGEAITSRRVTVG